MELFASPMACSLASHITALEAGLPVKLRFGNSTDQPRDQTDREREFAEIHWTAPKKDPAKSVRHRTVLSHVN